MNILIFFILGLIVGSFLNVLIYRLQTTEKIFLDRSHCPHCKHIIRWYDNIPIVSFILLHGRCRDCQKKISWQYPLVETFTGIIFALIGTIFFKVNDWLSWLTVGYYFFIASSLIVILVYDWLYMEIPSIVLWVSVALAIAYNLSIDWLAFYGNHLTPILKTKSSLLLQTHTYAGVLAAFWAFLFFFFLAAKSKEKWMGMGDAYLVILLGLLLGWPQILLALFLAFFLGSIYGLTMLILGRRKMRSQIPFAPFLVLGAFITLLFYTSIINWYFSLYY